MIEGSTQGGKLRKGHVAKRGPSGPYLWGGQAALNDLNDFIHPDPE